MNEYEKANRDAKYSPTTANYGQAPEGGWPLIQTLVVWGIGALILAGYILYELWDSLTRMG